MQDVNKLIKTIEEYNGSLAEVRSEMDMLSGECKGSEMIATEKFNSLKSDIENFLCTIEPILINLCTIYSKYISYNGKQILYDGKEAECLDFDSESCFEVYKSSVKSVHDSTASLILKKIDIEANCQKICRCYCTVKNIARRINEFAVTKTNEVKAEYATKYAILEERLRTLEADRKDVERQLQGLIQDEDHIKLPENLLLTHTYEKDIHIPFGFSRLATDISATYNEVFKGISSVLKWKLNEEGVLLLSATRSSLTSAAFSEILKTLILRVIFCYPAASKRIVLCDNTYDERIISFAGALSESIPSLFMHGDRAVVAENSEEDIFAAMNEINDIISRRLVLLGRSGVANITEYNYANSDNVQPLIFVLLHGYPQGFSRSAEIISNIFKNGKKAGVYFIVTTQSDEVLADGWTVQRLPEIASVADKKLQFIIADKPLLVLDDINYEIIPVKEAENLSELLSVLRTELSQEQAAIPLSAIIPEEKFTSSIRREKFSKILSIPIGKKGAKVFTLDLDSEGDAHAIISGTTGSGKSSLINTLVLSAATLYSPCELEIHLISIIKSEFEIFAEQKLPHLKTIITQDNLVGANDVLDYLVNEMQKRQNLIGSKGDIVNYNASVDSGRKLPRCIIIVDEYQQLVTDDSAREKMNKIAQLGRSCGMSLILSSQAVPVEFRNSIELFRHRFEFSATGDLIPDAARRKNELEALKGLCFYGRGNAIELTRIAYPGKEGVTDVIKDIIGRYPDDKMTLNSEITPILVESDNAAPFISKRVEREYREDGVCRVRLGRRYLSNLPVEFPLSYKNNLLCICGEYLLTKQIETSIIKDTLYLSRHIEDKPTLYYVDFNKNPNWARKANRVKSMRDNWIINSGGRFAYYAAPQAADALADLEDLVREREEHTSDDDYEFYPVVVMLTCVDQIADDSDECYAITSLMDKGKNNNVFFVMQLNEFSRSFNAICDKIYIMRDVIIVPDRTYDEENYTSAGVLNFLSQTEAADTSAKELLRVLPKTPLNKNLNIICINNDASCFIPYDYTDEYLINLLTKEN